MVRKLKSKENLVISYDEYLENKSKYLFEIEKPLKSDLKLNNPHGQGKKIERLTKELHLRIGELENDIIKFGSEEKNLTRSTFVRYLILEYGKQYVRKEINENYYNSLKKYKNLFDELELKRELRENLLKKRGADKKTANQLCYQRTKLKFEIENIEKEINHLSVYLKKYEKFFEDEITNSEKI